MTTDQAKCLADWVECCARLQQGGEHYIESLDTTQEPLHVSRILMISVSVLIAQNSFTDTTRANVEQRGMVIFHALRKTLRKTLRQMEQSRET